MYNINSYIVPMHKLVKPQCDWLFRIHNLLQILFKILIWDYAKYELSIPSFS